MLGKVEGRRRKGRQRVRWLNGIADWMDAMDVSLSELRELVMDREAWRAAIHGVAKSRTQLSDWTELNWWHPGLLIWQEILNFSEGWINWSRIVARLQGHTIEQGKTYLSLLLECLCSTSGNLENQALVFKFIIRNKFQGAWYNKFKIGYQFIIQNSRSLTLLFCPWNTARVKWILSYPKAKYHFQRFSVKIIYKIY